MHLNRPKEATSTEPITAEQFAHHYPAGLGTVHRAIADHGPRVVGYTAGGDAQHRLKDLHRAVMHTLADRLGSR